VLWQDCDEAHQHPDHLGTQWYRIDTETELVDDKWSYVETRDRKRRRRHSANSKDTEGVAVDPRQPQHQPQRQPCEDEHGNSNNSSSSSSQADCSSEVNGHGVAFHQTYCTASHKLHGQPKREIGKSEYGYSNNSSSSSSSSQASGSRSSAGGNIAWHKLHGTQPMIRKPGKSGFRGVYASGNRWKAQLHNEGKQHYIGTYDTPEEAAAAHDEAARKHCSTSSSPVPTTTGLKRKRRTSGS
jgi:hypothetical protein